MLISRLVMLSTNLNLHFPAVPVIAAVAFLAVACNGSPDLGAGVIAPPPGVPIRFAADIQPIFTLTCTRANCHEGPMPPEDLNLEPGMAYVNLVGVTSSQTMLKRVDPGMSDLSYLIMKLEQDNPPVGSRMPQGGPFLDIEVLLIRDWIDQGAPNN